MRKVLPVALLALLVPAARAETITLCYNYGCHAQARVRFDDAQLAPIEHLLLAAHSAAEERIAIARAIGEVYALAGGQSPIWHDRGGNYWDDGVDGRMDCIDNAADTTAFLLLFERHGWLRFHSVEEPVRRGFFAIHWAARIRERASGGEYTVDSWFFDKDGGPVAVFALPDWMAGARANGR